MAGTAVRALLFLAGGVAAAAVTAYVSGALDPYLGKPEVVAATPDASAAAKADSKTARLPGESKEAPSQPSATLAGPEGAEAAKPADTKAPSADTAGQEKQAKDILAPSFDVVRAEPDGSIVIAGKAAPNSKVEIVIGAEVIGNATAGPEGDFAVALDENLKPGNHQIVLRSTAPDNVVATSPETAIVSIPETKDGQVLALVEQPGVPSKLISVPEPEKQAEAKADSKASQPSDQNAATTQAPPVAQEEKANTPSGQAGEQQAAVSPAPSAAEPKPGEPMVKVEAVEIEGRKIFIAGAADPGRKVRAYANDILLGEVITSPGGRFLIETERDLPVGDYIIRVDGLEPDGAKVVTRAAVPFEREPGEAISAVAPDANAPEGGQAADAAAAAPGDAGEKAAAAPALPAGAGEIAATAPEALAPKLENVDGAVIIRRGDSLWRISRRVYGLGVRYSTIYLANQEQIRDPDMIWPGQVFKVPEKTREGEAADMEAIGSQATTAPR
ncbi:LysM peptidoglycan-binding domain-containing protein [Pseudaminobacter arsenicus]|uniref:LysM peptidoglycan-binding domain-containing protein n=1 Tax=Borborobacter arsenicus TaxID=1851146 RepID=A0A432V2H8_9HYPH|nr:LysM peptidoglycan-binding domain-containing protein [Pseudaminobacter arsenicus]RUM96413.1 LysM peptidoglycan-binding domain-containing protein [Pseudaminobacter arsenicus]